MLNIAILSSTKQSLIVNKCRNIVIVEINVVIIIEGILLRISFVFDIVQQNTMIGVSDIFLRLAEYTNTRVVMVALFDKKGSSPHTINFVDLDNMYNY